MRGIFRFEMGAGRWWACVEDGDGRVNIQRRRYTDMKVEPPFEQLPIMPSGASCLPDSKAA